MKSFPRRRCAVVFPLTFFALSAALPPAACAADAPPTAQSFYKEAAAQIVGRDVISTPLEIAKKRELLKSNAATLRLLREGMAYPFSGLNGTLIPSSSLEIGADMRYLARLLVMESEVAAADQDWNRAANSDLDAMRLAIDAPRGGAQIATVIGYAQKGIGRRALWALLPRLDAESAANAARRLQLLEARRPPLTEMLPVERAAFLEVMQPALDNEKASGINAKEFRAALDSLFEKETLAASQLFRPDLSMPDITEARKNSDKAKPGDTTQLVAMNRSTLYGTRFLVAFSRAQNALLATSLAQRAYVAKNKREPETLADLVEARFLESIPLDPFSGQPLRFRKTGDKFVIYSIGPDGQDDLGRAIVADVKTKNTQPNSNGDIVAGRTLR